MKAFALFFLGVEDQARQSIHWCSRRCPAKKAGEQQRLVKGVLFNRHWHAPQVARAVN